MTTEEYDRGEKLSHYQRSDSLKEILLVAHDQRHVEVSQRTDGPWERQEFRGDAILRLESLGCELPLAEVYRNPAPV